MKHMKFLVGLLVMLLPVATMAQRGRGGPGYLKLFDSNLPFDAKDLAGIWSPI